MELLFKKHELDTPLGPILAIANDTGLYLLEFLDWQGLEREIGRLRLETKAIIVPGQTAPIHSIEQELKAYFDGTLKAFKTPLHILGTPFQKRAWEALQRIPYGETRSYRDQAYAVDQPTAFRAVANANGKNRFAIVIPCHRIINHNGGLGGYGGGIARKKWLIEHEKKYSVSL